MSDTPRTDATLKYMQDSDEYTQTQLQGLFEHARQLERELAAAIEQRDKASADLIYTTVMLARLRNTAIADGLMDCKGYDLFPDGTMRPAHGLGEWVKAEEYDKLHAAAEAAQAQRDKALVAIKAAQDLLSTWIVPDSRISDHQVLNDLLGILDNKDLVLFLKECGK